MSGNNNNVPDQGGVGFIADDDAGGATGGDSSNTGGNAAAANTAQTGAGADASDQGADDVSSSGRYTNFNSASPESNVNPPGAPQSSHGSATRPIPGGTTGRAEGRDTEAGIGGSAGGVAGTST